jgi:hypothetical protein
MNGIEPLLREKFPIREDYIDCAGVTHTFEIHIRDAGVGSVLHAREITDRQYGYEFDISEAVPFHGLGGLRKKIRRALACKYLAKNRFGTCLTHDVLDGRIAASGLVVDGNLLSWDELKSILTTHEGFPFHLVIGDEDS